MNSEEKYLKYKKKYLYLVKLFGGNYKDFKKKFDISNEEEKLSICKFIYFFIFIIIIIFIKFYRS